MVMTVDPLLMTERVRQIPFPSAIGKTSEVSFKKSGGVTGVDLGSKAIKLVSTRWRKSICEVTRAHCLPWKGSNYSDVDLVAAKVADWLNECGDPRAREVALSLPADLVDHESIEIPAGIEVELGNRSAMSNFARKVMEDLLGASAGDAIFDGWLSRSGGSNHLHLTWADRSYVRRLWQQLAKAGWYCRSIEAAPAPLIRAARNSVKPDIGQLIIDLSGTDATIFWALAGLPQYSRRRIPLSDLMPSELVANSLNIRTPEAEVLLESTGIRIGDVAGSSLAGKLGGCLSGYLDALVFEIQRTRQYIARLQDGTPIEEVVISGGVSSILGLPEWVRRQLNLEVRLANVPDSWQWSTGFSYTPQLATAVALAHPEGQL